MSNVLSNLNTPKNNIKYLQTILPIINKGRNKNKINWEDSIGCVIEYEYDWLSKIQSGKLEIINFKNKKIYFKNIEKGLYPSNIIKGKLGGILGLMSIDFYYKIGDILKSDKRDLIIINNEYKENEEGRKLKWYKYHCNKCDNEDWVVEGTLRKGIGCNACCIPPKKPKLGINTIWDKAYWMVDLGVSEEDAKKYTPCSGDKIEVVCPNCGNKKIIQIIKINKNHSISCTCGDGYSYPEKFIYSMLKQLDIKFITQYSPEYLENKRNDFYLINYNIVIEADGKLGHEGGYTHSKSDKTLEECVEIDKWKEEQNLKHGIKTIRINCFESNIEYIKNNILNSELNKIFNLNNINWNKCEEFALGNLVKEVCDYWREHREINGENVTTVSVGQIFGIASSTISSYLKKGTKIGWCEYDSKEEMRRNGRCKGGRERKAVLQFSLDGELVAEYLSISEVARQTGFTHSAISACCRGEYFRPGNNIYKGYRWMFLSDYEKLNK